MERGNMLSEIFAISAGQSAIRTAKDGLEYLFAN